MPGRYSQGMGVQYNNTDTQETECQNYRHITQKSWDRRKSLHLAFLDKNAAFYSIPRPKMWAALAAKNVSTELIYVIKSACLENKWERARDIRH